MNFKRRNKYITPTLEKLSVYGRDIITNSPQTSADPYKDDPFADNI